jgi:hypothetical protein
MKKRGSGYEPSPKSRAREMAARTGAAERLDAIERQKAEYAADDAPLPDAPRRLSLAERTAARRAQLPPGLDLDAQIARDKEAALGRVPVGYSNPDVPMVKTTQDWQGEYASYPLGVARNSFR